MDFTNRTRRTSSFAFYYHDITAQLNFAQKAQIATTPLDTEQKRDAYSGLFFLIADPIPHSRM